MTERIDRFARRLAGLCAIAVVLAACGPFAEDLGVEGIFVVNQGREPVTVEVRYYPEFDPALSEDVIRYRLGPGRSSGVASAFDANHCIPADLVVFRRGVEIQRVSGPICVPGDTLTLDIGDPGNDDADP